MSTTHAAWLAGLAILLAAAWLRGAEYDEQYTLFLTAGIPRPAWPTTPFPAALIQATQTGHATFRQILTDLRNTDVHPPIYFWIVSIWRTLFGPSLFTARLLSVTFGATSLALVARIAIRIGASPAIAVLTTALSYGFAYTNMVARGFAPAETALLAGTLLTLQQKPARAGIAFGIAIACNYLAVFPAIALTVTPIVPRLTVMAGLVPATHAPFPAVMAGLVPAIHAFPFRTFLATLPFLLLDAWCFAAQHASRTGQFPPFHLLPALQRLIAYQEAAIFGALPLYWPAGPVHWATLAAVALGSLCLLTRTGRHRRLIAPAIAPAIGLLILGLIFNNAPIEFRYLSFGLPFLALLTASEGSAAIITLLVQAAGIAGLLLAPQTMQPAQAAAAFAAPYASDHALAVIPAGNDGVGIVGAAGIEAPPSLMLTLAHPGQPVIIPTETTRVILFLMAQDDASRAAIPQMRQAIATAPWHLTATGPNVAIYDRDIR